MSKYEPELGQMLFSNSRWNQLDTPSYVTEGLGLLGAIISQGRFAYDPTGNVGPEADFENDVFAMRAFCWCDGDFAGHEDGCPPNFVCGDFVAGWYKHSQRGASQNREMPIQEWARMMTACLASLLR